MLTQQITSDILEWIVAQANAGHKPEAVLHEMRRSGWDYDVALKAIEESKRSRPGDVPEPVAVPSPHLVDKPCAVQTSDRKVHVLAAMTLPRVVVFGDLLSEVECDELVDLARTRIGRSQTVDNWSGGNEVTEHRTSEGMFFARGENEVLRRVEARIAELLNWPVDHGEGMQILRYAAGAEYRPHHDYFDPSVPGNRRLVSAAGQRVGTLVIYLNSPIKGGGTTFPDVGLEVAPVKGNAVFFSYSTPHPSTLTLHGGAPVTEGEKWVATKWLRERVFAEAL